MRWNGRKSMPQPIISAPAATPQRLGARELVETRGRDVKASDNLFD
jgi:hypothetical protein